ncbi:hypothetical protein HN51_070310 [Arachis hypogaea]
MNEENPRGYAGNPRMRDLVLSALILSQIKRIGMEMDQWNCGLSISGNGPMSFSPWAGSNNSLLEDKPSINKKRLAGSGWEGSNRYANIASVDLVGMRFYAQKGRVVRLQVCPWDSLPLEGLTHKGDSCASSWKRSNSVRWSGMERLLLVLCSKLSCPNPNGSKALAITCRKTANAISTGSQTEKNLSGECF